MQVDYAGIHYPNGPLSTEDAARIMKLPSPTLLMLATEARYHYDAARKAGKQVMWRAVPRQGKRPAEIGWQKYAENADEVLNLWDEQPHYGEEGFVPYNELDLNYERGDAEDDFANIKERFQTTTAFLSGILPELRKRLPAGTKIFFPPWTPDHGDIEEVQTWAKAARDYDGLVVHAYGTAEAIIERLSWYVRQFPGVPIFLGEWNADDYRSVLKALAKFADDHPTFIGAAYFAWHWHNPAPWWPDNYNVDRNDDLYEAFENPPTTALEEKPMTRQERIAIVLKVADEFDLDRVQFLGGGFAESGINLDKWERWGIWPDISFGMYHQTVRWAEEGDQSASPENIEFVKNLYFDPEHATRVAAAKFKAHRQREATALDAWCRYNWPGQDPAKNPNRGNYAWGLQKAAEELGQAAPTAVRTWGPDIPDDVILQRDDWSCSLRSSFGALWTLSEMGLGKAPTYDEWKRIMVPAYANGDDGLRDASGAGLVKAFAQVGIHAANKADVTLAEVQEKAGTCPVMIGGRNWYHWVYVRGVEEDGTLILENPAPGYMNIRHQLRDSFAKLGPFSMVWIDVPAEQEKPKFEFLFGFKAKAEEIDGEGEPLEDEHPLDVAPERFNIQLTSEGLMVYSKKNGEVTFIRG